MTARPGGGAYVLGTFPVAPGLRSPVEWHLYRQARLNDGVREYTHVEMPPPLPVEDRYGGFNEDAFTAWRHPSASA